MVQYEYKVTVSECLEFEDRWIFQVWERNCYSDGSRGEWKRLLTKLATYNAWKQHSKRDLREALRSLL